MKVSSENSLIEKVFSLPIHVDAGFGEHEIPKIQVRVQSRHGGEAVVDDESSVGNPKSCKNDDHANQHFYDLKKGKKEKNRMNEMVEISNLEKVHMMSVGCLFLMQFAVRLKGTFFQLVYFCTLLFSDRCRG